MISINYRGGMISEHGDGIFYVRASYYAEMREYKSMGAAKAHITREHNAWRKSADAEHYARLRAINGEK